MNVWRPPTCACAVKYKMNIIRVDGFIVEEMKLKWRLEILTNAPLFSATIRQLTN